MNQMNQFMPKGKMADAPQGATVISPLNAGLRLIPNFVSTKPSFSAPLDVMLGKIWARVKQDYFGWSGDIRTFKLGAIKDSLCASDLMVVSLLVKNDDGIIDGAALEKALQNLTSFAKSEKGSLHISDYLCQDVPALRDLVDKYCASAGINCYFYPVPSLRR